MIHFGPDKYGLTKDPYGRDMDWKPLSAENHWIHLDPKDSDKKPYIDMLRRHKTNEANGGNAFYEETPAMIAEQRSVYGEISVINTEQELSSKDIDLLKDMTRYQDTFNKGTIPQVIDAVASTVKRFNIIGIKPIDVDTKRQRIKGEVINIMSALEDAEIWSGEEIAA